MSNDIVRIGSFSIAVKHRIAEGGFGVIELAYDVNTKRDYVIKRCGVSRSDSYDIVKKEIKIMQLFKSPYIVELLATEIIMSNNGKGSGQEALLLLEYCPNGHLLDRLLSLKGNNLPMAHIHRIFGQLLIAMKLLHTYSTVVVHRDLKLENVLLGSDDTVKLCDFGSCVIGLTHLRTAEERSNAEEVILKETTPNYRAPEMIDLYMRNVLTEKTDVWALGCILYAMCYLIHPFGDGSTLSILNCNLKFPENSTVPLEVQVLIRRMLDMDPEARPSVVQLIDAIVALNTGNPLPPYEVSADALKRKQERIALEKIRDLKKATAAAAKRSSHIIIPKGSSPIPLTSSSVAARRLAAIRGVDKVGVDSPPITSNISSSSRRSIGSSSSSSFSSSSFSNNNSSKKDSKQGTFDPFIEQADSSASADIFFNFSNDAPPASSVSSAGNVFDPFADDNSSSSSSGNQAFDPFPSFNSSNNNNNNSNSSGSGSASSAGIEWNTDIFAGQADLVFGDFPVKSSGTFENFRPDSGNFSYDFNSNSNSSSGITYENSSSSGSFPSSNADIFNDFNVDVSTGLTSVQSRSAVASTVPAYVKSPTPKGSQTVSVAPSSSSSSSSMVAVDFEAFATSTSGKNKNGITNSSKYDAFNDDGNFFNANTSTKGSSSKRSSPPVNPFAAFTKPAIVTKSSSSSKTVFDLFDASATGPDFFASSTAGTASVSDSMDRRHSGSAIDLLSDAAPPVASTRRLSGGNTNASNEGIINLFDSLTSAPMVKSTTSVPLLQPQQASMLSKNCTSPTSAAAANSTISKSMLISSLEPVSIRSMNRNMQMTPAYQLQQQQYQQQQYQPQRPLSPSSSSSASSSSTSTSLKYTGQFRGNKPIPVDPFANLTFYKK